MPKQIEYVFDPFKLTGLKKPRSVDRSKILEEIADYALEEILDWVGSKKSPVKREPTNFKNLSKEYKAFKKSQGAPGVPNLELSGDMLDSLKSTIKGRRVAVGIYDPKEVDKADNHNKVSAKSKNTLVPRRRFIPGKGQTFRQDIIDGMKRIIVSYED